jgi:hypothetical protein
VGRQDEREQFFYAFCLESHVPQDHVLRGIDAIFDFGAIRKSLAFYCSSTGRPSVDPELMIRMLLIGYSFGIRSERRLSEAFPADLPVCVDRTPQISPAPSSLPRQDPGGGEGLTAAIVATLDQDPAAAVAVGILPALHLIPDPNSESARRVRAASQCSNRAF